MTPGTRLGTLTLVEIAERNPYGHFRWRARCDCGFEVVRDGAYLAQRSRQGLPTCPICTTERMRAARHKKWRRQWREEGTLWTEMQTGALLDEVCSDLESEHGAAEWAPSLRFGSIEVAAGHCESRRGGDDDLLSLIEVERIRARPESEDEDEHGDLAEETEETRRAPRIVDLRSGSVTVGGADRGWDEEWESNTGPNSLMRCPGCGLRMRLRDRSPRLGGAAYCPVCRTRGVVTRVDGWRATLQAEG